MKLAISIFLFLFSHYSIACSWKRPSSVFISLSSSTTYLIKELGLLNRQVKAISKFHEISNLKYRGELWGGGNFLSQKKLKANTTSIFFIDESRNLSMALRRGDVEKFTIIKTSLLDPVQVHKNAVRAVRPYIKNCQAKLEIIDKRILGLIKNLRKQKLGKIIFFLGEIKENKRLPNLIMVQDSLVKLLLKHETVKTFDSKMAYVNWSMKELRNYSDYKFVGLVGSHAPEFIQTNSKGINIYDPLALLPGFPQILFLEKLLANKASL